jgi:hypothetical protein
MKGRRKFCFIGFKAKNISQWMRMYVFDLKTRYKNATSNSELVNVQVLGATAGIRIL